MTRRWISDVPSKTVKILLSHAVSAGHGRRVVIPVITLSSVERVLKEFEGVLDSLDDHLRTSLSEWTGDARRTYQAFQRQAMR
jgi:hypothetical protein